MPPKISHENPFSCSGLLAKVKRLCFESPKLGGSDTIRTSFQHRNLSKVGRNFLTKHEYKENSTGWKFFWADIYGSVEVSLISTNLSDSYSLPKFLMKCNMYLGQDVDIMPIRVVEVELGTKCVVLHHIYWFVHWSWFFLSFLDWIRSCCKLCDEPNFKSTRLFPQITIIVICLAVYFTVRGDSELYARKWALSLISLQVTWSLCN